MDKTCLSCHGVSVIDEVSGLCETCLRVVAQSPDRQACRVILDRIDSPILLMQPDPRVVFTANRAALSLFGKALTESENHRGGEVFSCIHSFTELGCGKDINCEDCKIKAAIVATFEGVNTNALSSTLTIRHENDHPYLLTITTQTAGRRALVKIEGFNREEK